MFTYDLNAQRKSTDKHPTNDLDPVLQAANVEVEREELVEPDAPAPVGKLTRMGLLKHRLGLYGNRVLTSGSHLWITFSDTLTQIAAALAGSIVLLPVVILARGMYVLLNTVFSLFKPLILSLVRGVFDLLRGIIWPFHTAFLMFNKRLLFPILKAVKEDDTVALVAFGVLIAVVVGIVVLLNAVL
jgi:hypothetical protein